MLDSVVIVLKCASGVVRWVNVYALHLAGVLVFEGLEGQQVVAEDELVVELVLGGDPVGA